MTKKRESSRKGALQEFREFLESRETPPPETSETIFAAIRSRLQPRLSSVYLKLLVVHSLVGAIVLLFCPQLGIGPFAWDTGLMGIFMRFGPQGCAAACGALFLAVSALASSLLLRPEEARRIRHLPFVPFAALASLSLAIFLLLGARAETQEYLFWIGGAIPGGWLTFELAVRWRALRAAPGNP